MMHRNQRLRRARNWAVCLGVATVLATVVSVAETHKNLHYTVAPGSSVFIINQNGSITVHAATSHQLQVSAVQKSDKVEIDASQTGNRVTLRTHMLQKVSADDARVDYEVALPSGTGINIDSENGPIKIENVQGNVTVDSDAGSVDLTKISNGFVQVQTINAAINLKDVNARTSVVTTGGTVTMNNVIGQKVSVETTNGSIAYTGDFSGGGSYTLMNHSGDIEVKVPANASLDLTARSVKGTVTNDFPFQKPQHTPFQLSEGRSFAGTSNSGASSVELRSFSGKIRVTKQ